jgi:hypothetical protein
MNRLSRLLFHNFGWKLLSLAVAVTIWVLVAIPPEVLLEFERRHMKSVPIQVRWAGESAQKFRVRPETVTIAGPSSHVARVNAAVTDPVDLAKTGTPAVFRVNLSVEDPYVRIESTPRATVEVTK